MMTMARVEERLMAMAVGKTTIVFGEVVTRHGSDAYELRTLARSAGTRGQVAAAIAAEIEAANPMLRERRHDR